MWPRVTIAGFISERYVKEPNASQLTIYNRESSIRGVFQNGDHCIVKLAMTHGHSIQYIDLFNNIANASDHKMPMIGVCRVNKKSVALCPEINSDVQRSEVSCK